MVPPCPAAPASETCGSAAFVRFLHAHKDEPQREAGAVDSYRENPGPVRDRTGSVAKCLYLRSPS